MFKVGQKVKIKDAMSSDYIGKIGTIEEINHSFPRCCRLNIDGKSGSWACAWLFSCLEPIDDSGEMNMTNRPPLGLKPRYIWEEERICDIKSAIVRYLECNKPIPKEWIDEYNGLVEVRYAKNKAISL